MCLWKKPGRPAEQIQSQKESEKTDHGATSWAGCGARHRNIWTFNSTDSPDLKGVCEKVEKESGKGNSSLAQFGPYWTCTGNAVVGGGGGNLSLWSCVAQKTETGQKIKD